MTPDDLDAALRDPATGPARLSDLHARAAERQTDPAARRFHLTHAWVHALVTGDAARTAPLEAALRDLGGL